jgi:myo-inositol-1(or 4)-monophosphatase
MYCVSIGYERDGVLEAGAIYAPVLDELFAAQRGAGATRNGAAIRVSSAERVADAMVCTGFVPGRFEERNIREWTAASRAAQAVRRDGSAALDLAAVAMGRFDAFWEWRLKPWDVAAGTLIVREAGGTVSAIDGEVFDIADGSILATNGRIHAELAAVINGA